MRESEGHSDPNGKQHSAISVLNQARKRSLTSVEFSEQVYHVAALCNVVSSSWRTPQFSES